MMCWETILDQTNHQFSHTSLKEVEDKVGGIFCGSLRGDPRFEKIVASLAPKEDRH